MVDLFSGVPAERRSEIIRKALLSRVVELKLLDLFSAGKLSGTVHTCVGQELSGAILSEFLEPGDLVFSNHRCHGHFLSITGDARGLISEVMGKSTGVCAGRGGSQHLYKDGFCSNGILSSIAPVAAGRALAKKLLGESRISVVFLGDGALGEGVVYETFNLASKWSLPLLIVLEDNGIAQSTLQRETLAGTINARPEAFGIRSDSADTWNPGRLYQAASASVSCVRRERRPAFLRIQTYRLKPHSKGDDDRPLEEIQEQSWKDPLNRLLQAAGREILELHARVEAQVQEAVNFAENAPFPEANAPLQTSGAMVWRARPEVKGNRIGARINELFKLAMAADPKLLFIGEDVRSPYGGAFKISAGLSDLFPGRVYNTPVSEAAIVGLGAGLAMEGFRPFVEIMFGDFAALAFDQILNGAAKFEDMFNGQVNLDLVIRTPMGGRRGYGPTHSQTLDSHFLGIPGLRVVAIHGMADPEPVYRALFRGKPGPTLLIENKLLYGQSVREELPRGFVGLCSDEDFPAFRLAPESSVIDVTLIGYGGMAHILVEAADRLFEEHDLIAQVLCPTQIYPFCVESWLDVLRKGRAIVVAEEGQGFSGFSSELLAQIAEREPSLLGRCRRIAPYPGCIPASRTLEEQMLPGVDRIVREVAELCDPI